MHDEMVQAVLRQLRQPAARAGEPAIRAGVAALLAALAPVAELLPEPERPADVRDLLDCVADSNSLHPLRIDRGLPVTVVFHPSVHPGYFTGDDRIGEAAWRLCYTDG